jgi:hypothetical protein
MHNDVSAFVFHIKIILITKIKNGGHSQYVGAHSPQPTAHPETKMTLTVSREYYEFKVLSNTLGNF